MVDAVGELLAAAGQAIAEDNGFLKEKSAKRPLFMRVMYYVIPMSILTGIYIWILTINSRRHLLPMEALQQYLRFQERHS